MKKLSDEILYYLITTYHHKEAKEELRNRVDKKLKENKYVSSRWLRRIQSM